MTLAPTADKEYLKRAIDITINIALLVGVTAVCFHILRPFLPLIAWGVIVAIAIYPLYAKLKAALGGRGGWAATILCLGLLAIFIVPAVFLTDTLVDGVHALTARLRDGGALIPPPPAKIAAIPLIGAPISEAWTTASTNLSALISRFAPQIKDLVSSLLSASAGVGMAVLQLALSILVAGVLLANADAGRRVSSSLSHRILGDQGPEFEALAASTIRSGTTGIIGVALIQSVFAGFGFLVFGLPAADLWAIVFLFAAVLQVGLVVLIPAVIYGFTIATMTKAIVFMIWCLIVGLMDNVLKPLLLGRGAAVPIVVVFLGAMGGFISMGLIGLFIGAIVLSVGYKLLLAWLGAPAGQAAAAN